jgi:hypothetical protein
LRSDGECTEQETKTQNDKPDSSKTHLDFSSDPKLGDVCLLLLESPP